VLLSREGVVKLCNFGTSGALLNSYAATFIEASVYISVSGLLAYLDLYMTMFYFGLAGANFGS